MLLDLMLLNKVAFADNEQPQEDPGSAHDRDELETESPTTRFRGEDRKHHDWGQDCSEGGAALQDAVSHRPALSAQEGLGRLQPARPVR